MFFRILKTTIVLAALWTAPLTPVQAQVPAASPTMTPDQEARFEETHLISVEKSFWGIGYVLDGREIQTEKELETIIAQSDDAEAVRDLRSSEDQATIGWLLIAGGGGMVVTGGVVSWNGSGSTFSNLLVLGGLAVDALGGVFWKESQSEQLGAVDRYNQLVREDNGISFLDLGNQSGLAFVEKF